MTETLTENRFCEACGVDVRPGSLFCYNCGKSVMPKTGDNNIEKENKGEIRLRESVGQDNGNKIAAKQTDNRKGAALIVETPSELVAEKPGDKSFDQEHVQLKSAAALRKKSKTLPKKDIEVFWEEPDNAPNGWFIFIALILTVFAVAMVYIAMYLR